MAQPNIIYMPCVREYTLVELGSATIALCHLLYKALAGNTQRVRFLYGRLV